MKIRVALLAFLTMIHIQNLYAASADSEDRLESKFLESLSSIKAHLAEEGLLAI
jgi:hypothetical protein